MLRASIVSIGLRKNRLGRPAATSAGVSGSAAPRPQVPASPTPADAGQCSIRIASLRSITIRATVLLQLPSPYPYQYPLSFRNRVSPGNLFLIPPP